MTIKFSIYTSPYTFTRGNFVTSNGKNWRAFVCHEMKITQKIKTECIFLLALKITIVLFSKNLSFVKLHRLSVGMKKTYCSFNLPHH